MAGFLMVLIHATELRIYSMINHGYANKKSTVQYNPKDNIMKSWSADDSRWCCVRPDSRPEAEPKPRCHVAIA